MKLTSADEAMLSGAEGPGVALAMRLLVGLAEALDAPYLIDIESAHIDSCLYHGQAGLDFVNRLVELGARVRVPSTLNVGSLDLLHPGLVRWPSDYARAGRALMDAYVALGCAPTWTCAPYQVTHRPGVGVDVAWAESNAIVFANSVLGARTARYGDFADICAAITGRAPYAGLHVLANRRPTLVLDCSSVPAGLWAYDDAWAALGFVVGHEAGESVPLITGIPPEHATEDRLKGLGATAAASGGLGMFHLAGVTPEAPSAEGSRFERRGLHLSGVSGDRRERWIDISTSRLRTARDALTTAVPEARLDAVAFGTPHFSTEEFRLLATELAGRGTFADGVQVVIGTSRAVLAEAEAAGYAQACAERGATILTDTCSYLAPVLADAARTVMTNSGKWAWYAPANLGYEVVLGSLGECAASALAGKVVRDDRRWQ